VFVVGDKVFLVVEGVCEAVRGGAKVGGKAISCHWRHGDFIDIVPTVLT